MKLIIVQSILVLLLITSCDSNDRGTAESINVSEINEPCDCMDAYEVVSSEMLDLLADFDDMEDYEANEQAVKQGEEITKKYEEIDDRCDELSFSKSDFKECSSFESVYENMKEINQKMGL